MKTSPKKSVSTLWLFSLALAVALVGCSNNADDGPDLEETTDASSVQKTEYIPASEEGPAQNVPEPRLPAVATENSEEGALKALDYFWESAQYARLTGDSTFIELVSSDTCEFCKSFVRDWSGAYETGKWAAPNGEVLYEISEVWMGNEEDGTPSVDVFFSLTEPDTKLYDANGQVEHESEIPVEAANWFALMFYDSTAQRWEVDWIGLEELVAWEE